MHGPLQFCHLKPERPFMLIWSALLKRGAVVASAKGREQS